MSFQEAVYTVGEADQTVNVCLSSLEPVQEPITIHLTTIDLNATGDVVDWYFCHHSICYASVRVTVTQFHCQLEEVKASCVCIQIYVLIV